MENLMHSMIQDCTERGLEKGGILENLMHSMIQDCTERGLEKCTALKAMRALSVYFGGQQLYIPQRFDSSSLADEIRGVMADEVGDAAADRICDILGKFYGGVLWYVPLERTGFREEIAKEILTGYDGTTASMRELCRRYNITYNTVYRFYYEAQNKKLQKELDF